MNERPHSQIEAGGRSAQSDNTVPPTPEQRISEALTAASSAQRVATEEVVTRIKASVHEQINTAFTNYARMNITQKILMAVAGAAAFGAGFLIKGLLVQKPMKNEPNGVQE